VQRRLVAVVVHAQLPPAEPSRAELKELCAWTQQLAEPSRAEPLLRPRQVVGVLIKSHANAESGKTQAQALSDLMIGRNLISEE